MENVLFLSSCNSGYEHQSVSEELVLGAFAGYIRERNGKVLPGIKYSICLNFNHTVLLLTTAMPLFYGKNSFPSKLWKCDDMYGLEMISLHYILSAPPLAEHYEITAPSQFLGDGVDLYVPSFD